MNRFIPLVPALLFLIPNLTAAEVVVESTPEVQPVTQSVDILKANASSDPIARDVIAVLEMADQRSVEEALENLRDAKEAAQKYVSHLEAGLSHPDSNTRIRQRLLETLGDIRGEKAKELIIYSLQNDPERDVRLRALSELHQWINDEDIPEILVSVLDDPDYRVQGSAHTALVRTGDLSRLSEILESFKSSNNLDYRRTLLSAGLSAGFEGMPLLIAGLEDSSGEIRYKAMEDINRFRFSEEDAAVQTQTVERIQELLKIETSARVLERAVDFLARNDGLIGSDGRLLELIDSDNPNLKGIALRELGRFFSDQAVPLYQEYMADDHVAVRRAIAHGARYLPSETAHDVLATLIKDDNAEVLREAAYSIGEIKDSTLISEIAVLMDHESNNLVRDAINALRRINTVDIAPILGEVVDHQDRKVRESAIDGITRINNVTVARYLLPAVDHEDARTSERAVSGLERLTGAQAGTSRAEWQSWLDAQTTPTTDADVSPSLSPAS